MRQPKLHVKSSWAELNFRQVKLMRRISVEDAVSVRDYMRKFGVCSMTAYRDLAHLQHAGQLVRVGKGRATVYMLPRSTQ